ncbi:transient receptor potential channel-like [Mytilus californianus]|uniref:transient receptor potential channel-like n=1 Tax=Mytilus californianus TaxID=6549 RepID=UPI002247B7BC|nr:transient receptor potential channel-like [Mytilus californianus]
MHKLKRELPIMFNRRFTHDYFTKIEKKVKRITEKDWMITIFAVRVDAHYNLWERITDGIIRAWSLEEKDDSSNGGEYISKYVANIDGLTREELFAGYRINTADERKGKKDEDENNRLQKVYMIAFLGENTETIRHVLTNNTYFCLSKETFKEIWKQKTSSNSNTTIIRLLKSVHPDGIKDHKAVQGISEKLLKGLCFSKIGMITCCGKKLKTNQNMPDNHVSDTLRVEVFFNKKDTAAAIWCTCPNPMMTALISSMYLTALANIAEEQFEENLQEEYESHAELFLSRAVKLLEKMHADDESMAIAALEYVSEMWDNIESPLHFAQQFNIEEFISHSKIQIDASRRLFPVNKNANDKTIKSGTASTKASDNKSSIDDSASQTTPDTTTSRHTETQNMSNKTTGNTKSDTASKNTSDSKSSMVDSASQSKPDTTTAKHTETQNMSDKTSENTKSDSASKNASGSKFSIGDSESQTTPDITAAKNTETQNMSDKTTEKAAASQNLSKNNTASSTALKTQEPLLNCKTYPMTISGWFSFVKDNWRTSKHDICTAPVTKIAVHVVFFITALIMFSYFLIGNLDNGSISLLEGLVFIYMSGDFLEEIWSMFRPEKDCIWSHQRIILHLWNLWNCLDVLCSILYIVGFCVHNFDSISIVHTRRIYSIALIIMFLRLLNLLLLSKTFGIIIIMVKEMLADLLKYLVILTILIFAAGVAYHANVYPNHQVEFWRIFTIIKIPYWQVYGELYLDTLEASDPSSCTDNATIWKADASVDRCPTEDWITPVIAAFYMMLTNWLLLNIVIAMFGARFNAIQQKSKQKWRFNRHSVIIDYEDKIPSPLNFPCRILSLIKYSTQCSCRCCSCPCCSCRCYRCS